MPDVSGLKSAGKIVVPDAPAVDRISQTSGFQNGVIELSTC
jgi:hypothetical protein